jgi:hypothetical protein
LADSLLGRTVKLEDGRTGLVTGEYWGWRDENGLHEGHRLRVAITELTCPECPHRNLPVTRYVHPDAESVTLS